VSRLQLWATIAAPVVLLAGAFLAAVAVLAVIDLAVHVLVGASGTAVHAYVGYFNSVGQQMNQVQQGRQP